MRMKLDGLKQVLKRLEGHDLPISILTIDRHKHVRRYMHQGIIHKVRRL